MVEHSPKILTSEEKATTEATTTITMKSEDGEAVISLRFGRLAAFAQHC